MEPPTSLVILINSETVFLGKITLFSSDAFIAPTLSERRKLSVEAQIILSFLNLRKTPESSGLVSEPATESATETSISFKRLDSILQKGCVFIFGIIGKSFGSTPKIWVLYLSETIDIVLCFVESIIFSSVMAEIKSVSIFAGKVISPGSSIFAPTKQVIPISRFVAAILSRPFSVFIKTLFKIGKEAFLVTTRSVRDK